MKKGQKLNENFELSRDHFGALEATAMMILWAIGKKHKGEGIVKTNKKISRFLRSICELSSEYFEPYFSENRFDKKNFKEIISQFKTKIAECLSLVGNDSTTFDFDIFFSELNLLKNTFIEKSKFNLATTEFTLIEERWLNKKEGLVAVTNFEKSEIFFDIKKHIDDNGGPAAAADRILAKSLPISGERDISRILNDDEYKKVERFPNDNFDETDQLLAFHNIISNGKVDFFRSRAIEDMIGQVPFSAFYWFSEYFNNTYDTKKIPEDLRIQLLKELSFDGDSFEDQLAVLDKEKKEIDDYDRLPIVNE